MFFFQVTGICVFVSGVVLLFNLDFFFFFYLFIYMMLKVIVIFIDVIIINIISGFQCFISIFVLIALPC